VTESTVTPDQSNEGRPEAHEDLQVDDETAEQVTGGDAAQTTEYRGRYQLKLDEARRLLS
jgi:hypothetical protein